MKDLNKMNREDIFNSELIGENGIPDLQTEIDKMQNGSQETSDSGFGFGGGEDSDIFGFGSQKKTEQDSEEED